MKILIIAHDYTPRLTPRALRWSAIVNYWISLGYEVDIVSGPPKNPAKGKPLRKTYGAFAKWIYDRTWKNIYWPDYACLWFFSAFRRASRLLKKKRYDVIVSVSLPFTGHLVAYSLRKRFCGAIWLVDIGDPFYYPFKIPELRWNNQALYARLNYFIEQRILNVCHIVTVTTAPVRDMYLATFRHVTSKIHVIPPMRSDAPRELKKNDLFRGNNVKRLVYIGTLYQGIRNPAYLLGLLHGLQEVGLPDIWRIHFLGNVNNCESIFQEYASLLGDKLYVHGPVTHGESLEAMQSADILVNIGNATSFQLPSKVVEYAATGKPILNIISLEEDSTKKFLEDYPAVLHIKQERRSPTVDVLQKVKEFILHPPSMNEETATKWRNRYGVEAIGGEYEYIIRAYAKEGE